MKPPKSKLAMAQNLLWAPTVLLMLISLYMIFAFVPTERTMGIVQRIFYIHVPAGLTSFVAFFVVAAYSVAYLKTRNRWYDRVSYASAEIGVLFTTINLITGMLWAKPAWNTYWSWDPRLTTLLLLWFIYAAYLLLRNFSADEEKGARFAAVYAIIGFLDVPIVYFSIRWWRTIHPQPVLMGDKDSGLHPDMQLTFQVCMLTFVVLYAFLLCARLRLESVREAVRGKEAERALQMAD